MHYSAIAAFLFGVLLTSTSSMAQKCVEASQRFQNVHDRFCLDSTSGLIWGSPSRFGTNYAGAAQFCEFSYGEQAEHWRLPTLQELRNVSGTVADRNLGWTKIRNFIWTKTTPQATHAPLLLPSLDDLTEPDEAYENRETFKGGVICVRRAFGCYEETGGFKSDRGGCRNIADGLTWSEVSNGAVLIGDAPKFCSDLKQGGHRDWRVPTASQLLALGDGGKGAVFGRAINQPLWSSDRRDYPYQYRNNLAGGWTEILELILRQNVLVNLETGKLDWKTSSVVDLRGKPLPIQHSISIDRDFAKVVCVRE